MIAARTYRGCALALAFFVVINIVFWQASSKMFPKWEGVPPAPSYAGSLMMALGDPQFAYRSGGLVLQGLGDGGGQYTSLRDYDYQALGRWFAGLDRLDPASNHVPMTAAYYFGSTRVPRDVAVVVDYLAAIGQNPAGNKWRWLAYAVLLARHRLHDDDLALDLAYKLSHMQPIGDVLPAWARHMPAVVLSEKGEAGGARKFFENLVVNSADLTAEDAYFVNDYMVYNLHVPKADVDKLFDARKAKGLSIRDGSQDKTIPEPKL